MRLSDLNLLDMDKHVTIVGSDGIEYYGTLVVDPFYEGKLAFLEDGEEMPNVTGIYDDDRIYFE